MYERERQITFFSPILHPASIGRGKWRVKLIETILQDHRARYPDMQVQDVYKLLHQAALGSEHAVSDPDSARDWLTRELAEMGAGVMEPLIDPISPGGEIVRVHLRPFVAAGHESKVLLDVFIRSANKYRGEVRLLDLYWREALGILPFSMGEMTEFYDSLRSRNYPAVHHSPV